MMDSWNFRRWVIQERQRGGLVSCYEAIARRAFKQHNIVVNAEYLEHIVRQEQAAREQRDD